MKTRVALGAFTIVALSMSGVMAGGEGLKSGLPEGGKLTPFHPMNVTGPFAGKRQCLV
jgi:hypothetical protein